MPELATALTAAALAGALVGSFLNVVIHRVPLGECLVSPGSHCTSCTAAIAPYDNVPVASWILLRGRCRHCAASISPRYPLVELLTALVFAIVALARGFDAELLLWLPFAAVLIALAAIDLDHRIVPNKLLLPGACWAVAVSALVRPDALPEILTVGVGAFLALLLATLAYPGGMGMGDVKLAGVMGLYLGLSVIPAMLAAFLLGSAVGLAVIVREGPEARKKALPFAPFLALGGLVGLIVGPELIDLYVDRLL